MSQKRLLIAGWLLVLGLSATLPLSAIFHGVVHVGPGSYTARAPLHRPIVSLGGTVHLAHGTTSTVVVIGGDIDASGTVRDDLVSVMGATYLRPGSHSQHDVLSVAGGIYRAPGARVDGRLGGAVHAWNGRQQSAGPNPTALAALNVRLGLAAGLGLLLIGICLTIVFPWQVVLIATTLRSAPLKSLAAGLMNLTIFLFLVVPLGLSLAGLPFAVLLSGAAALAWLFGLTAGAVVMGRMMARSTVSLVWATAAGLIVLAFCLVVPVLGLLAVAAVGLTGAGALAVALISRSRPILPAA